MRSRKARGRSSSRYDMRRTAPGRRLAAAFAAGVTDQGLDVVFANRPGPRPIKLYFRLGAADCPGAMFTPQSHTTPAAYNGNQACAGRVAKGPVGARHRG